MENLESTSILIVEDEKIVAWDIQEQLEKLGYNVVAAVSSGVEAMEAAARYKPDLALMDIKIDGQIDGIETARVLYNSWNIPIVYLTAHSDEKTLAQATQTNPLGYLLKPFQPRELHTTIQIALQRHQNETLANTMQQWLANTLNSLGEATIATDCDGMVTFMNPMAEQLTGWNRDEALGSPVDSVLQLFCGETREPFRNPGVLAMRSHNRVTIRDDCWLRNFYGKEISVQNVATPILNEAGKITGSAIVLIDNTERNLSQMELWQRRQSLERFQSRLISKFARQNTQFNQLSACTQVLIHLIHPPQAWESSEETIQWALQQLGNALDLDYAWVSLYHEDRDLAIFKSEYRNPHNFDGIDTTSMVGTQVQLGEFPYFYNRLLLGEKWSFPPKDILPTPYQMVKESTNRLRIYPIRVVRKVSLGDSQQVTIGEIGILSSNYLAWTNLKVMLLTEIIAYAATIPQKVDLEPTSAPKITELDRHQLSRYLEALEREWESESSFVNDLLNFQTPIVSLSDSTLTEIRFQDWLPDIGDRFLPQIRSLQQTLTYQIVPQDLTFLSYPQMLERIVTELLNNACKHSGTNQSITVSIQVKGEKLELIVSNTGTQIAPNELESIFQPFYRITHSNPWDYNGTGLGLALVKRLVARLGGKIHAESGDGMTRFVVLI